MVRLGLVDQDPKSTRYQLGLDLYLLGQAAADRYSLLSVARPLVESLAADTGDTAYLIVRHRYEAVCIFRAEGGYPIKAFTTNAGERQPLGLTAGSIALLTFLEQTEIDDILNRNRAVLETNSRFDMNSLPAIIARARAQGYVLRTSTVVDGIATLAFPVFDYWKRPLASISLTAIDQRMNEERMFIVVEHCQRAVRALENALSFSDRRAEMHGT